MFTFSHEKCTADENVSVKKVRTLLKRLRYVRSQRSECIQARSRRRSLVGLEANAVASTRGERSGSMSSIEWLSENKLTIQTNNWSENSCGISSRSIFQVLQNLIIHPSLRSLREISFGAADSLLLNQSSWSTHRKYSRHWRRRAMSSRVSSIIVSIN